MSEGTEQLLLSVINTDRVEGNTQVQCRFGHRGGSLGSAKDDDWQLMDRTDTVLPGHAHIEWTDGRFCLCDSSGKTFVNGASFPVGRQRKVVLTQGDELRIGPYHIRVLTDSEQMNPRLDQILGNGDDSVMGEQRSLEERHVFTDLNAPLTVQDKNSDPLWVLQQEYNSVTSVLSDPSPEGSMSSQFNVSPAKEGSMDQGFIELPDVQGYGPLSESGSGVSLLPLMRGLGLSLACDPGPATQEALYDMGKTLRVMVEGLLRLQAEQAALADKLLRPVEDNPLRLGLNCDETLALMFADQKSPVHLSAPAAVTEVLHNIRIHHIANQQAIHAALQSMLQAFSPDALLQRFCHYRRGDESVPDGVRAWEMYQHYFSELTSPRQQGVQRLFQQVYAQAYDRAIREGQEIC